MQLSIIEIVSVVIFCVIISKISADCGYESCRKTYATDKLNIHIIAHSHDDVGWVKTVDNYYADEVQHIITNVVNSLAKNPDRRFTQVETYYFNRWWSEQTEQTRNLVHQLVSSGQLAFANGGYTVNDEGAAHYNEIIDQMTYGLKILDHLFGRCGRPLISWQIDPFGASKEMASLYAQMGFDGHVFNRGVQPKGEFIWESSPDLGQKSNIFTTILHDHYNAPEGFDFENGNDITTDNKKQKADSLVSLANQWNRDFGNSGHVLMPFGDDFRFQNADHYFSNLDKLIDAIHEFHGKDIHIFYSTPMCYLLAVNQLNRIYETRQRDYFPFWTGFFTSRPSLKRQERWTNSLLQIGKQLDAVTRLPGVDPFVNEGRNEIAVMTHHDAITGTSPQWTVNDYDQRLFSATDAIREVVDRTYEKLLPLNRQSSEITVPKQIICDRLNISQCLVSETSDQLTLLIYNPMGRPVSQWFRIPVISNTSVYEMYDSTGSKVDDIHIVPVSQKVLKIPERTTTAKYEIVFRANITALGFVTYFVKKSEKLIENLSKVSENLPKITDKIQMKGKGFTLLLDSKIGNIESIKLQNTDKDYPLRQSFKFYKSNSDNYYVFCSEGSVNDIPRDEVRLESVYKSGSIHEVTQVWNSWITQTIRVYEDREYAELEWIVGSIPIDDNIGKEVITRFETNFKTKNEFFTDANGRQNVKRVRTSEEVNCGNYRNSISNNYYPVYERIFIRDVKQDIQLTILTDRAQGGSSEADGQLELMLHRRLIKEVYGINLNETGVDGNGLIVRGKHYLFFKPINESPKLYRDLGRQLYWEPLITFSTLNDSQESYKSKYRTQYSGLTQPLPENVHLLTLEKWSQNKLLVRLEHIYQKEDNNSQLSKPVIIDLQNLFEDIVIKDVVEMTLSANQLLSESQQKKLKWISKTSTNDRLTINAIKNIVDIKQIQLIPQEIRTFIITVDDHQQRVNCSLQWVPLTDSKIPSDAIVGGFDVDSSPLYVCRYKHNNDIIPGKANNKLECIITSAGKSYKILTDYEILVGHDYDWVHRHGADAVPDRSFIAGHNSQSTSSIYVGKCDLFIGNRETQVVGKVDHKFYYGWGDEEKADCPNHKVMIC
ncbi:lysosomal alpha-mannosidase-like [Oppia nitens]|uniref:lysosomal alpha-mannosidase-like n=1 Tax=Oppia nitens TaxID=1686743 RepID=UPI0023DA5E90|nr:lysosomal alpha-mannosidase-like [Oppia nitens]